MAEATETNTPTRLNGRYDYRHHCGRLLFRAHLPAGTVIEIRCPKCGKAYVLKVSEERIEEEDSEEQVEEESTEEISERTDDG